MGVGVGGEFSAFESTQCLCIHASESTLMHTRQYTWERGGGGGGASQSTQRLCTHVSTLGVGVEVQCF